MSGSSQIQTTAVRTQTVTTNPALSGIVQRKCACGGNAGFTSECEECRSKRLAGEIRPLIQPKLKISQPGDKYEQEADRVAEQVMRMQEPTIQRQVEPEEEEEELLQAKPLANQITPLVQRQVDEEEEELLQTKHIAGQTPEVTQAVASNINALRGGGQPLDPATRAFMEPRFGFDFGRVRVHADGPAAEMAHTVKARAFTVGTNVVFGAAGHASGTVEGRKLLAHELTHVVQQRSLATGLLQRQPTNPDLGAIRSAGGMPEEVISLWLLPEQCDPGRPLTLDDFGENKSLPLGKGGSTKSKIVSTKVKGVPSFQAKFLGTSQLRPENKHPGKRHKTRCGALVSLCKQELASKPRFRLKQKKPCAAAPTLSGIAKTADECENVIGKECDRGARIDADRILNHEQLHFDITCVAVLKANLALWRGGSAARINKNILIALVNRLALQYDRETKHGCDVEKQSEWENKVRKQLLPKVKF